MKKLSVIFISLFLCNIAFAGGTVQTVCHDKLDKKGNVVKDKKGNVVQECKKIKVHKKLDTVTPVPSK